MAEVAGAVTTAARADIYPETARHQGNRVAAAVAAAEAAAGVATTAATMVTFPEIAPTHPEDRVAAAEAAVAEATAFATTVTSRVTCLVSAPHLRRTAAKMAAEGAATIAEKADIYPEIARRQENKEEAVAAAVVVAARVAITAANTVTSPGNAHRPARSDVIVITTIKN